MRNHWQCQVVMSHFVLDIIYEWILVQCKKDVSSLSVLRMCRTRDNEFIIVVDIDCPSYDSRMSNSYCHILSSIYHDRSHGNDEKDTKLTFNCVMHHRDTTSSRSCLLFLMVIKVETVYHIYIYSYKKINAKISNWIQVLFALQKVNLSIDWFWWFEKLLLEYNSSSFCDF